MQGFGLNSAAGKAELSSGAFFTFYFTLQELCWKRVMNAGQHFFSFPFEDHFYPFLCVQRFSCIIGPNGSGKSNIIDSLLFVFGYRAQKIRSKKLSVLIHNSDEHQDIPSCSVEVHFQKITDKVGVSPALLP